MLNCVCYLGDDHLGAAAAYLAGVMTHFGIAFDYIPSNESPGRHFREQQYALYVLSDYSAARFAPADLTHLVASALNGSGVLMIGGWESFFGRLGEYHNTLLADVLPVTMLDRDDRTNYAQPCLLKKVAEHEILARLPFDRPPGIGGLNVVIPRPNSQTLLAAVPLEVRQSEGGFAFTAGKELPLLVVGENAQGRSAALATDVAPHWVGGFVDWGDARVHQEMGEGFIEVGNWYARFFRNLLVWTGRLSGVRA